MNDLQNAVNQAMQLRRAGRLADATALYRRILASRPDWGEGYERLAGVLYESNQPHDAVIAMQLAIRHNSPNPASCHNNLGVLLHQLGRFADAASAYRKAIAINPVYAIAHRNLGDALRELNDFEGSRQSYLTAIGIDPNLSDARNGVGLTYFHQHQYHRAIEQFQLAMKLNPPDSNARLNLILSHFRLGDAPSAEVELRRAIALAPDQSELQSELIVLLNYTHGDDPQLGPKEAREFDRLHIQPLAGRIKPHRNNRDANRRLRIGYISPDFREHSVAYFLKPVIDHHDRGSFFIACYAEVSKPDSVTSSFMRRADLWRSTVGLSHQQVAEQIRADEIDILIELAGHTLDNRLMVMGLKPAPVQISWLGFPTTTGVSTMDYRVTDSIADPPGTDDFYTEKLLRLPGAMLVYEAAPTTPRVGDPPVLKNGFITFGSFGNLIKFSAETLQLWADILRKVPGSRLVLKAMGFGAESGGERIINEFRRLGITADRIEMLPWSTKPTSHLEHYDRMDIALDTFPYAGTTTTCEALWMGVPVVSLAGKAAISRMGATILKQLGLDREWVANTKSDYVSIACDWAGRSQELSELRRSLRDRFRQSPMCDAANFTRQFESKLREIWADWCPKAD